MRIAKIAALIMAVTPLVALAQQHKPSPGTSATSATSSPSATKASPASQPATNLYGRNSGTAVSQSAPQLIVARPAVPVPIARPMPAIPAPQVALQPAPTSIATSVVPSPVVTPAPSEPTAAVNYAQGQLTVVSQSASLGAVMKLISARTGAVIDLAPELQNEPVIAQIGPSAVREVMTSLLDSPKIDYIIMGSGNASGGLERVLVRTRQTFGRNVIPMNRPEQSAPAASEFKLNPGSPAAGVAKPQTTLTQEQLMENWKKIREEKKQAEIAQQQQDRENEANNVEPPPQPEVQPEPQPTNAVPDNPPLK